MSTSRNSQKAYFTGKRPLFYYVTDLSQHTGIPLEACIRRALDWGVDFIQIREKNMPDRAVFELVCRSVELARGTECSILVNGRADIALSAGAHGVHLPTNSLSISEIRHWVPDTFLIGKSVHTEDEIRLAWNDGADYVLLGHLFPTPSKSGYGQPLGLEYLRKVCTGASVPVFGLGGIQADRIESIINAGAVGIAGISLFQSDSDFKALKKLYPGR